MLALVYLHAQSKADAVTTLSHREMGATTELAKGGFGFAVNMAYIFEALWPIIQIFTSNVPLSAVLDVQ